MKNVLITTSSFGNDAPEALALLEGAGLTVVFNPYRRKLTEEEAAALLEQYRPVGMIAGVEPLTRAVLTRGEGLKVISRCGIGMDSVDLAAAADLGIRVTNTPDAPTIPVAELTLGMILALLRQIHRSDASIRGGQWERPMGSLLYGKTVGIVGCGRIGTYLGRLLAPFGCTLLGHDPFLADSAVFRLLPLDELLAQADVVSLHLPCTPESRHLLDARRIGLMKEAAFLVNAARGGLVDEGALCAALAAGRLGGAALDCFEEEPYTGPLRELPNVLLTGHIGSYAREGRAIMEEQAAANLVAALREGGAA